MGAKKEARRRAAAEAATTERPVTCYLEARVNGKWTRIDAFPDDTVALRKLVAYRDANASQHVRITNSDFKVVLDVPATGT
jgi:hypothetical protein